MVTMLFHARQSKNKDGQVMSLPLQLGLVYLISELLLTVTCRSRSRTGTKQDRSTLRVLWLVIMASVAAGIYVATHCPSAALPYGGIFAGGGVGRVGAGLFLRGVGMCHTGGVFTGGGAM